MKTRRIAGVTIEAATWMPDDRFVLVVGSLSAEGKDELARRAARGEVAEYVLAELLVKEGKAIAGWVP
jgi:hypothetical protein